MPSNSIIIETKKKRNRAEEGALIIGHRFMYFLCDYFVCRGFSFKLSQGVSLFKFIL